jgi:hypothetical protein
MRQLRLISLICISIFLSGCFQTKLHAPLGRQIRLLAQDEPVKFRTEYKNWYVLYGFVPIWTTQPEEIIRKQNLVEVRARTQDTVLDAIITTASMFLPIMIFPQHVIVEGNRKSDLTPQAAAGHVPSSAAPKALGAAP